MDIVFTFDMTCSMTPCIYQVRQELDRFLTSIKTQLPNVRIGIITHGDYDSSNYIIRKMDITSDIDSVKSFIQNVETAGTNNWNEGECYEKVLTEAKTLSWDRNSKNILVVIGDDIPHTPFFELNTQHLDWRKELECLHNMNIVTYGVNAPTLSRSRSKFFYSELSNKSLNGNIIPLDQFIYIIDILLAIVYTQQGESFVMDFEREVVNENRYNRNMEVVFNHLLGRVDENRMTHSVPTSGGVADTGDDLLEVSSTKFQVLSVSEDKSIKDVVTESGAVFKVGNGYYQLTKAESISEKKEVVLQHKTSGTFYSGQKARKLLGLSTGTKNVKPSDVPNEYIAFIQSKSHNRGLKAGSKFLYETSFSGLI